MKKICLMSGVLAGLMCICTTDGYARKNNPNTMTIGNTILSCPPGCVRTEESREKTRESEARGEDHIWFACVDEETGKGCEVQETQKVQKKKDIMSMSDMMNTANISRSAANVKVPKKIIYKEITFDDSVDLSDVMEY